MSEKIGSKLGIFSDLTELSSSTKSGNYYFILLIIIFQQFQLVQVMDVIPLFHLRYYLINLDNFNFLGFALTSELTVMGE